MWTEAQLKTGGQLPFSACGVGRTALDKIALSSILKINFCHFCLLVSHEQRRPFLSEV